MATPSGKSRYLSASSRTKPFSTRRDPFLKKSSFAQSISTSIDISPIIGTPLSSDCEQNPFPESPALTPDISISSSVFSTESKKEKARKVAKKQTEELRSIRKESRGVQEYLLERLQRDDGKSGMGSVDAIGLDFYEQELERMKDSLYSMGGEFQQRSTQDVSKADVSRQLLEMQREIQHMRDSLTTKQSEIRKQELESLELKQVVKTLEKTVLDLGGSVDLGKVTVDAPKQKQSSEMCASSCDVF